MTVPAIFYNSTASQKIRESSPATGLWLFGRPEGGFSSAVLYPTFSPDFDGHFAGHFAGHLDGHLDRLRDGTVASGNLFDDAKM